MIVGNRDYVINKYKLHKLKEVKKTSRPGNMFRVPANAPARSRIWWQRAVEVNTPFNNPITGFCAFTHKAGIHAKAILNNPSTYEIIDPADFGMTRYVHFASR